MTNTFFFGYGSLVNARTHSHAPWHAAQLSGWRRAWRRSPGRRQAFLTVVPEQGCTIEGVIAGVEAADWAALDEREFFYKRLDASDAVIHAVEPRPNVAVYSVPEADAQLPDGETPILRSYLDVVLQGFLDVFGAEGAERFFDTTTGWETPILDDRAEPLYPRAQVLPEETRGWIDDALTRRGLDVAR